MGLIEAIFRIRRKVQNDPGNSHQDREKNYADREDHRPRSPSATYSSPQGKSIFDISGYHRSL
jgi:hypothetical protein